MKYDFMQIERMESGGHRIEVRNETESDVFYADGGPEALDIVKRVLAGAEVPPTATVPKVLVEVTEEDCLAEVSGYRAEWERLAARIGALEEIVPSRITNLSTLDIAKRIETLEKSDVLSSNAVVENGGRIGELEIRIDATQLQYELDFGRLRNAFTNATETMRKPKEGDA